MQKGVDLGQCAKEELNWLANVSYAFWEENCGSYSLSLREDSDTMNSTFHIVQDNLGYSLLHIKAF